MHTYINTHTHKHTHSDTHLTHSHIHVSKCMPYCVGNKVYRVAAKTGSAIQFQRVKPLTKLQHCPQIVLCTNPYRRPKVLQKVKLGHVG